MERARKRERGHLKRSSNRNTVASAHQPAVEVRASERECVCVCRDVREQMLHYSRYKSHVIINASYYKQHLAQPQTSKIRGPLLTNATHFLQKHTSLNQSVRTRPDSECPAALQIEQSDKTLRIVPLAASFLLY